MCNPRHRWHVHTATPSEKDQPARANLTAKRSLMSFRKDERLHSSADKDRRDRGGENVQLA